MPDWERFGEFCVTGALILCVLTLCVAAMGLGTWVAEVLQ